MKKVPPAHVRENLEVRIAGHIMAVHRDYPDFIVSEVQVHEREQYKNGTKYAVVTRIAVADIKNRQKYRGWYCTFSTKCTYSKQWQATKNGKYITAGTTDRLKHLIDIYEKMP